MAVFAIFLDGITVFGIFAVTVLSIFSGGMAVFSNFFDGMTVSQELTVSAYFFHGMAVFAIFLDGITVFGIFAVTVLSIFFAGITVFVVKSDGITVSGYPIRGPPLTHTDRQTDKRTDIWYAMGCAIKTKCN